MKKTDDKTLLAVITLDLMSQSIESSNFDLELFDNDKDSDEYTKAQTNKKNAELVEELMKDVYGLKVYTEAKKLLLG